MVPLYLRVKYHYINSSGSSPQKAEVKHWVTQMVKVEGGIRSEESSSWIEGQRIIKQRVEVRKETVVAATASKGIKLSNDSIVKLLTTNDDQDNLSSIHWRELYQDSPLKIERTVLEVYSEDIWIMDVLLELPQPSNKIISHGLNSGSTKEDSKTSAQGSIMTGLQGQENRGGGVIGYQGQSPQTVLEIIPTSTAFNNHHLYKIASYQEPLLKDKSMDLSIKYEFKSSSLIMGKESLKIHEEVKKVKEEEEKTDESSLKNFAQSDQSSQLDIENSVHRLIRKRLQVQQDKKLTHSSGISFFKHIPGKEFKGDDYQERKVVERVERRFIDLAFLYSFPLIKKVVPGKGPLPIDDPPLLIETEYSDIKDIAKSHGIEFFMSKEHVTYKSLGETISNRARIIHLTCHGVYSEDNNTSQLMFEMHDRVGLLDAISDHRFNSLVVDLKQTNVELVFISACHSQQIGEIIKEKLKKAVVIAINKSSPVKDKACTLFAKFFYSALLKGETIREAINEAKKYLRSSEQKVIACCCHHTVRHTKHATECRWMKAMKDAKKCYTDIFIRKGKSQAEASKQAQIFALCDACRAHDSMATCAHNQNHSDELPESFQLFRKIPECLCQNKEINTHSDSCAFYRYFYENFQTHYSATGNPIRPNKTPQHVCCCQPDSHPHNEAEKFMIIKSKAEEDRLLDEALLDRPMFGKFTLGDVTDHEDIEKKREGIKRLPPVQKPLMLLKRNKEIFEIITLMTSKSKDDPRRLLITEAAPGGMGLSEIVKFAADYCFERKKLQVVIYIDLGSNGGKISPVDMLDSINLDLELGIYSKRDHLKYCQEIVKKIEQKFDKDSHFILIFDNIDQSLDSFRNLEVISNLTQCSFERFRCFVLATFRVTPEIKSRFDVKEKVINCLNSDQSIEVLDEALMNEGIIRTQYLDHATLKHHFSNIHSTQQLLDIAKHISSLIDQADHHTGNLLVLAIEEIKRSFLNAAPHDTSLEKTSSLTKTSSLASVRSGENTYVGMHKAEKMLCLHCRKKLIDGSDQPDLSIDDTNIVLKPEDVTDSLPYEPNKDYVFKLESTNEKVNEIRRKLEKFQFRQGLYAKKLKMTKVDLKQLPFELQEGQYEGEVQQNTRVPHGRGIFVQKETGTLYEGWRLKGKRHGYGRVIESSGLVYEGEWKDNQPHGKGSIKYADGSEFHGSFKKAKREGFGLLEVPSQMRKYYGFYLNDQMSEQFTIKTDDGDYLVEDYYEDQKVTTQKKIQVYTLEDSTLSRFPGYLAIQDSLDLNQMMKETFNSLDFTQEGINQQITFHIVEIERNENSRPCMMNEFKFLQNWLWYQSNNLQHKFIDDLLHGIMPFAEPLFMNHITYLRDSLQIKIKDVSSVEIENNLQEAYIFINKDQRTLGNGKTFEIQEEDHKLMQHARESVKVLLEQLYIAKQGTSMALQIGWDQINKEVFFGKFDSDDIADLFIQQPSGSIILQVTSSSDSGGIPDCNKKLLTNLSIADLLQLRLQIEQSQLKFAHVREFINIQILAEKILKSKNLREEVKNCQQPFALNQNQNIRFQREILGEAFLQFFLGIFFFKLDQTLSGGEMHDLIAEEIQEIDKKFLELGLLQLLSNPQIMEHQKSQTGILNQTQQHPALEAIICDLYQLISLRQELALTLQQNDSQTRSQQFEAIRAELGMKSDASDYEVKLQFIDRAIDKYLQKKLELEEQICLMQTKIQSLSQEIESVTPIKLSAKQVMGAFVQMLGIKKAIKVMENVMETMHVKNVGNGEEKRLEHKMESLYRVRKLNELEKHLGYTFTQKKLLVQSLIHPSYLLNKSRKTLQTRQLNQSCLSLIGEHYLALNALEFCDKKLLIPGAFTKTYETLQKLFGSTRNPKDIITDQIAVLCKLNHKFLYTKEKLGNLSVNNSAFVTEVHDLFLRGGNSNLGNPGQDEDGNIKDSAKQTIALLLKQNARKPDSPEIKMLQDAFHALMGAIAIDALGEEGDFKFQNVQESTHLLLPYLLPGLADDMLTNASLLSNQIQGEGSRMRFTDIIKVSMDEFSERTFSVNDSFDYPGKLFNLQEFDIGDPKSFSDLLTQVKELESKGKSKLINILFSDDQQPRSAGSQTLASAPQYYIFHSHVLACCLRLDEGVQAESSSLYIVESSQIAKSLIRDFVSYLRNQSKQRVINDVQLSLLEDNQGTTKKVGLTLAQKVKMLINLNKSAGIRDEADMEEMLGLPKHTEALAYVKKHQIQQEKTLDSLIYTLEGCQAGKMRQGGKFIKQPKLEQFDQEAENTYKTIEKNKQYIMANILENQLGLLRDFINRQETTKFNELIILDEDQLRVIDYLAYRKNHQKCDTLKCPAELLSVIIQIVGHVVDFNANFDIFNGNIKYSRLQLSPSGLEGFIYNGNMIVMNQEEDAEKEVYSVNKCTFASEGFQKAIADKKKFSKTQLGQEEQRQVESCVKALAVYRVNERAAKKLDSGKKAAWDVMQVVQKIVEGNNGNLISQLETTLFSNETICFKVMSVLRKTLPPYYSRNLWCFFTGCLIPDIYRIILPWKPSPQHQHPSSDLKKNLTVMFIEDWWYDFLAFPEQAADLKQALSQLDSDDFIIFHWVTLLQDFIQYLMAKRDSQTQEESKTDPEVLRLNFESRIQELSEQDTKQQEMTSQETSEGEIRYDHEENDDLCEQGQLRRFVKALILPYKGYTGKVAKEFGDQAVKDINEIITFSLGLLKDDNFQQRLGEAFKIVSQ